MKILRKLREPKKIASDKYYVFDTETRGLRARPDAFIFGVLYGHNLTKVIYSVEEFKKEFKKDYLKGKYVFSHNSEYDLNVIYGNIYEIDKEAIFNNKFIRATNGICTFADSTNIYKTSVKKIGELLGLKKQELSNEFYDENSKNIKVTKKDIDYCIRDCEIVYKALGYIFELAGGIKITLATLSLNYFRTFSMNFSIEFNDNVNYFFNSYYGGRCEAFKIGKTDAICYDINSMYPDVMRENKFPNPKYLKVIQGSTVKLFIDHFLKNYEGCANVEVIHKDLHIGFLPKKIESRLCFPVGRFEGWYNFNELRYCIDKGIIKILKVNDVVYSKPMKSPFTEFINDLYTRRIETKITIFKTIFKLFMNTLYGKFAQKIASEMIYIKDINNEWDFIQEMQLKNKFVEILPFNSERLDCFLKVKKDEEILLNNSIPSFASYITSYARIKLAHQIYKYLEYDPVYCDTDSIFFEKVPPIENSLELGAWKLETKQITEIRGLKNYSYIYNEKIIDSIKGIPKSAEKIGKNIFEYSSLIKTREALRRNLEAGINVKRIKKLNNKYMKRIVLNNGNTIPIRL